MRLISMSERFEPLGLNYHRRLEEATMTPSTVFDRDGGYFLIGRLLLHT
ncbi:hypothetical protein [Lentilactobacillus farraginis]|nr:hypothetical protein [Lentilactobacillus farraginis]